MAWQDNSAMWWHNGSIYVKVTDHNRSPIDIDVERIEKKHRTVDGTLRKHTVAKKKTWSTSWENLPSRNTGPVNTGTVDSGLAAADIEAFYYATDGPFFMQLRDGQGGITTYTVMFAEFSKQISKRGPNVDFWNIDVTLEEV